MLTNQITKIDNSIFNLLVELEYLYERENPEIEQKLRILEINNKLIDLKIQRMRAEIELNNEVQFILRKLTPVSSPALSSAPSPKSNLNVINKNPRQADHKFKNNTVQSKILDCLRENGPQTSFQLAQNLGIGINSVRGCLYHLRGKTIKKHKDKNKLQVFSVDC